MALLTEKKDNTVKDSTKDAIEGRLHEAKGKVKEVAGKVTGNAELEVKGSAENISGKIQKKVAEIGKKAGI